MKKIINHRQYDDREFLKKLENQTISPDLFNHEAHLRMAWLYINQESKLEALNKISAAINGLTKRHGEGKKYHHTKTIAFVRIVASAMSYHKCLNWQLFLLSNKAQRFSKKTLKAFYSDDLINSDIARKAFVEADLLPLPEF